jgi:DNA-binding Lrp family transcriptional regulator
VIDDLDKRIIGRLQGDLPLTPEPFAELAQELGLTQAEVVARIAALAEAGVMRRFGATLRHQQSGFPANVMVAWRVEPGRIDEVGACLAAQRRVSHCYWRDPKASFPYNLYSMVHGRSEEECRELVAEMAAEAGVGEDDYEMLFSVEELKKTSMRYY